VSYGIEALIAVTNLNTLAGVLLWGNSTGLRYTTFSISMQEADSAHLRAPPVSWYVYRRPSQPMC